MWMLLWGDLRRRWGELALAGIAIALLVAALVAHRAVTSSAQEAVHGLAHRLGGNMLVVSAGTDLAAFHAQRYGAASLPDGIVETLRASPIASNLQSIEARLYGEALLNGAPVTVVGQDLRWPLAWDARPALVGVEAARATGLAAGGQFRLGGMDFQVLDVPRMMPDGLDRAVFMPLAAAQAVLQRPSSLSALRIGGCWCSVDVPKLAGRVEKIVPGVKAFTVKGMLQAQKGALATMERYSGWLRTVGVAVGAALVLTLVASVARRRQRELALLSGIGVSPVGIAGLLVVQAVTVAAGGALVGWFLAFPLTRGLGERLIGAPIAAPADLLVPALLLCAAVAGVAALLPAWVAVGRDPTVVLRENGT